MSLEDITKLCIASKDWIKAYWIIGKYLDIGKRAQYRGDHEHWILTMVFSTDTQSRNGFKKLHENWQHVNSNLRLLYQKNQESDVIIAAVMNLLRDQVADAGLRDKLYNEGTRPILDPITHLSPSSTFKAGFRGS